MPSCYLLIDDIDNLLGLIEVDRNILYNTTSKTDSHIAAPARFNRDYYFFPEDIEQNAYCGDNDGKRDDRSRSRKESNQNSDYTE